MLIDRILLSSLIVAGALIFGSRTIAATYCDAIVPPKPAVELGFTRVAISSCPKLADVSTSGVGAAAFFSGHQWTNVIPPPQSYTEDADGVLKIELGGAITTVTRKMQLGRFPLLAGSKGFYVEFTSSISDNDPDHFPALWMMPIEHNLNHDDVYEGDPPHFERWQEVDVDEGGFTKGFMGTAIAWEGIYPNYKRTRSNPAWNVPFLDRSVPHRFAVSFDPVQRKFRWYLDDVFQYEASGASVSEVVSKQHFYLIMTANHHGKKVPYYMKIWRVLAFTP